VGLLLAAVLVPGTWSAPAPASAAMAVAPATATQDPEDPDAPAETTSDYGRLLLLLDSSGSMAEPAAGGSTKIAAARAALGTVIGDLPDEAEVGLRVFGAEVFSRTDPGACQDTQRVVDLGTDNREELRSAVDDYEPYGETPIPAALREAAADLGSEGSRSIVLVSDGESTCAPDPCRVARGLADQGIDLTIDVVGLSVSGAARDQLRCIAEQGGGTYYDADDADDIEADLVRVAERAVRPFVLNGRPIEGGTAQAPTPVTVGNWIDTLGPEGSDTAERDFVFTRELAGTTLRVAAISQGESGDDGLRVEVFDPDGAQCDIGNGIRQLDARDVVGVMAVASEETDCDQPGDYRVAVSRRLGDDEQARFGMRVTEEPPVADVGFTGDGEVDVTPATASGRAQPVVGGTSFANATPIGPGRWSSDVVPGEAVMFSVPLEFGQAARVTVDYPEATAGIREVVGLFPPLSQVTLYNPMQAVLGTPAGAEFSGRAGRDALQLTTATPAVSRALTDDRGFNGIDDYSMAGDYYVAVSLARQDYSIALPFTVTVEVDGEPADGPTYDDGATWSVADGATYPEGADGPSAAPDATPGQDDPGRAGSEDDGSPALVATGAVAGLAGLAALVAALVLWRRRRA